MPTAYSYIRFSSPEQAKGDSLRRQIERSAEYARAHGLELDHSLRDLGVSGFKGANRHFGALARFLTLVEAAKIERGSYLLVESLDRLSREEVLKALQLFLAIIHGGITVVTLSDNYVYSEESLGAEPFKLMYSITVMARAHEESATKSDRISRAWHQKRLRAADLKLTARCPGWLRLAVDRKIFELIEGRVAVVHRIFAEAINGLGKRAIAKRLNDDQIEAFRGKNGWHHSAVRKVLASEAVLGTYQPHRKESAKRVPVGAPIKGYFPRIISDDDFWKALQAIPKVFVSMGVRKEDRGHLDRLPKV